MKDIVTSVKVILHTTDKFLLLETDKGVRDLPGGRIEYGEEILGCLKRELEEELGWSEYKESPKLHWVWTYTSDTKKVHQVMIVYSIFLKKKINFSHQEEISTQCNWIDKNEIKAKKYIPEMEQFLLKVFD